MSKLNASLLLQGFVINKFCLPQQPIFTTVHDPKMVIHQQNYPLLIVMDGEINEALVKLLDTSRGVLLARTDENIQAYPQIVEVARQVVYGVSYSVLKKVCMVL